MTLLLWLLMACGPQSASDTTDVCREGWAREADGHCYPPTTAPPSLVDALEGLPPCSPAPQGMTIDVASGCVGGSICPGATLATHVAELGPEESCFGASWSDDWVYCSWTVGIEGLFPDLDRDGVPDVDAGTDRVRLTWPHEGRTPAGVGVGASAACFVDSLGLPDEFVVVSAGDELRIQELIYDRHGVLAYDVGTDDGSGRPDGSFDSIYLYGTPE